MQNQHKAQKVGSYPLARFNVWQIPKQPFIESQNGLGWQGP